jgi:hypothetical protein
MDTGTGPRRRAALARKLDDAFAGCERWDLAPPRRRRAAVTPPSTAGLAGPLALAQTEHVQFGEASRL